MEPSRCSSGLEPGITGSEEHAGFHVFGLDAVVVIEVDGDVATIGIG
jgi:hypothetical protein